MAYFLINEVVNPYQWLGIGIILAAVVVMNLPKRKKNPK